MIKLTEAEYRDHCDSYDGFCTGCNEITRYGDTEPDAEKYPCPDCDLTLCMGIEQALICEHIEIVDSKED